MRTVTKIYSLLVGLLGLGATAWSVWALFIGGPIVWSAQNIGTFLLLLLFCWLCCCLPLYIRPDCTVDLSFISILVSALLLGPEAAVLISAVSFPLVVVPAPDGRGYQHIFNTSPLKTLFNIGDHALSYWAGGLVYYLAGGVPGDITLPGVLLPAALFILAAMVLNAVLALLYFVFESRVKFFPAIFQMFLSLLPSVACAAPIGYFLSLLLRTSAGIWVSLLFMLPLLLARYSFKLFLSAKQQQYSMVKAFTAALEAKDTYTKGHSSRVGIYAVRIAEEMKLSPKLVQRLQTGAIFHDIGKIGIPDAILQKPAALTAEERAVIQTHPATGVEILRNIDLFQDIIELVRHHHERYDGGGYPDGTVGGELPLEVYILGAADAYDAITSERPYCHGRSPQVAAQILREEAGRQFHPEVAEVAAALAESGALARCVEEPSEVALC